MIEPVGTDMIILERNGAVTFIQRYSNPRHIRNERARGQKDTDGIPLHSKQPSA